MLTNPSAGLGNVNARSMSRWSTRSVIMRDMDRASTMNPTVADMDDMPHWVDRSIWTRTLDAGDAVDYRRSGPPGRHERPTGAVAIARRRRVTARPITTITTSDDGDAIFTRSFDQVIVRAEAAADGWCAPLTNVPTTVDPEEALPRDNRRITAPFTVIRLLVAVQEQ